MFIVYTTVSQNCSITIHAVSVAVLSSAVLSIIGTALITSLVWCCAVIKMRKKRNVNTDLNIPQSTQPEKMLTSVEGEISLLENVAYGQVGNRK